LDRLEEEKLFSRECIYYTKISVSLGLHPSLDNHSLHLDTVLRPEVAMQVIGAREYIRAWRCGWDVWKSMPRRRGGARRRAQAMLRTAQRRRNVVELVLRMHCVRSSSDGVNVHETILCPLMRTEFGMHRRVVECERLLLTGNDMSDDRFRKLSEGLYAFESLRAPVGGAYPFLLT